MKKKYGISIYPDHCQEQSVLDYIALAARHGFRSLFMALLATDQTADELTARYGKINRAAKDLGFDICCDANPIALERLGVNISLLRGKLDLTLLRRLNIDSLRLDLGMSELEEAFLSKSGLRLELNMTENTHHLESLLAIGAKKEALSACMNYYPHRYTGLSAEAAARAASAWKSHGIPAAAFVTSQTQENIGPWKACDGLPTMELHRDLPIEVQTKHYALMDAFAEIRIGNAFASEDELARMGAVDSDCAHLKVLWADGLKERTRKALTAAPFSRRADSSEYLIRTLEARLARSGQPVEPFHCAPIKRGDVLMDNSLYGQYEGEVQIALRDMPNAGKTNVVGRVADEELFLIDWITGAKAFAFETG
jgi:hypothetical protein